MQFLVENWYLIVAGLVALAMGGLLIYRFFKLPSAEQLDKVREWLLWAVTEAEKDLGSGTGTLKLRQVYDLFVVRFPWLVKIISFDQFSTLVDEALVDMREMLFVNKNIKAFVEGGEENGS